MSQFRETGLSGLWLIEPRIHGDERGFFYESFHQQQFDAAIGHHVEFVQDNHSRSSRGVLRGLHYQLPPQAQGKLVRCVAGEVFDVAVDLRRGSATFGRHFGIVLSAANHRQLWIPEGFAHGFVTLSEHAELLYKTTAYWSPQHERALRWDDPQLAIAWPLRDGLQLSAKDLAAPLLADAEY
ncbi:dTDP-4-dehydrorhamnose 3,5-epimerase [Vogesella alkaliphila]|uniref:dTDP-4-dehydrorhamnose 3,5-epimerase n=1 Tax=Vogesella alkaliphila TaxID=1193621 RepID=A0ABQ2YPU6_9NEIS|nr:dTDP-4-dehydrorhamnose 3,5-epimerase [Vogesella alkaliphila]GGX91420.1 dTDP-4-dehydrorhamnose 3,5-epimerase [Vogesella alkaliphila]